MCIKIVALVLRLILRKSGVDGLGADECACLFDFRCLSYFGDDFVEFS